jgi:hypothetical protein
MSRVFVNSKRDADRVKTGRRPVCVGFLRSLARFYAAFAIAIDRPGPHCRPSLVVESAASPGAMALGALLGAVGFRLDGAATPSLTHGLASTGVKFLRAFLWNVHQ